MVQTPQQTAARSLEAFLQLPETKPASESIDGQMIQKPMPQGKHSRLQKRLIYKIESRDLRLVKLNLLQRVGQGRYQVHPLRQPLQR